MIKRVLKLVQLLMVLTSFVTLNGLFAEESKKENTLAQKVKFEGEIDILGFRDYSYARHQSSNIIVKEFDFGGTIDINEWVEGYFNLVFAQNEDNRKNTSDTFEVDEVYALFHKEGLPFYFKAGHQYLPFGDFSNHTVSQLSTESLGEISVPAIELGADWEGLLVSVYGFKGKKLIKAGEQDHVKNWGAHLSYEMEMAEHTIKIGGGYISELGETNGMRETFVNQGDDTNRHFLNHHVGAYDAFLTYAFSGIHANMEYIQANKRFNKYDFQWKKGNGEARPVSYHTELGYTHNLFDHDFTAAVAYERNKDLIALSLPESRMIGTLGVSLLESSQAILEYRSDKDFSLEDGGTGKKAKRFSLLWQSNF